MFEIEFTPNALVGLARLKKSEPSCFKKAGRLYQMAQGETLDAFLDRMEIEGNV